VRRLRAGLALAIGALLLLIGCRDIEVVTGSYANLADARGAIEAGWIPTGLPPGAHDLREAHDLDTNRRWGLFSFPPAEGESLRGLLAGEISVSGLRCDIPARIEWWPLLLRGELDPERVNATGLTAHRSRDGDLIFLVNWKQGRAYYWAPVQ
jgi:hypothetical protein